MTTATISQNTQIKIQDDSQSNLKAKKESFLGWMNGMLTMTWLTGAAARTKTGAKVVKAAKSAAAVKKTASMLKHIKTGKTVATWISRLIKGAGAVAAPFTGGASLAVGLAAGFALDLVVGEAIDAGITMANGGKVLDDSKGDWIKMGDWLGQGMHSMLA